MTSLPDPHLAARPHGTPLVARTVELDPAGRLLDLLPAVTDPREVSSWVRRGEGLIGWGRALEFTAHGRTASGGRSRGGARPWPGRWSGTRSARPAPGRWPSGRCRMRGSAAGATLVVPRWSSAAGTAVRRQPPRAAATGAGGHVLRRRALPRPVGRPGLRGRRPHHRRPARQGRARPGPLRARRAGRRPAVAAAAAGRALRHHLGVRRRRTRGRDPEMLVLGKGLVTSRCWPAPSAAPATTSTTWRSRRRWPARRRTSRSTSTPCAPSPTRCAPLLVHERSRVAVRPAPQQRHASRHRCRGGPARRHVVPGPRRLPAPSAAVCGTPTSVADEVIAELEEMDRGRYAGPVGWMDAAGDGEWGIALRCGAYDRTRPSCGCSPAAGSSQGPTPSRRSPSPTPSSCRCATPSPARKPTGGRANPLAQMSRGREDRRHGS